MGDVIDLAANAHGIAERVRRIQDGGRPVQQQVNALLNQFGLSQFDDPTARAVDHALRQAGLVVEPALPDAQQHEVVSLSIGGAASSAPACGVARRSLMPGQDPSPVAVDSPTYEGAIDWYDVELSCGVEQLLELLEPSCPGLTREALEDLKSADPQPKVEPHAGGVRAVSLIGVVARPRSASEGGSATNGELAFQLVESVAGPGWLITCWHGSRVFSGGGEQAYAEELLREDVQRYVLEHWATKPWSTSGDLGTAVAMALTRSHRAAYRDLESWLQLWEMRYYRERCQATPGQKGQGADVTTLNNLLSLTMEFRRLAAAQNNARGVPFEQPWYDGVTDRELDDATDNILDGGLKKLGLLFDNIRADMELVTMNSIAEQAHASAQQARDVADTAQLLREHGQAEEKFQHQLGRVTALLLVPTLIAGTFGANTALPGAGRWSGFELMLALMIVSSLAALFWVNGSNREVREKRDARPGPVQPERTARARRSAAANIAGSQAGVATAQG